jgi:hypothetical protein
MILRDAGIAERSLRANYWVLMAIPLTRSALRKVGEPVYRWTRHLLRAGRASIMRIREQRRQNPVADEVLALTAVVRPILLGTLYALKQEVVKEAGGYQKM